MTWQVVVLVLGIVYAFVIIICAVCAVGVAERNLQRKRLS